MLNILPVFTESQNGLGWKGPKRSSSSSLCHGQGQLPQDQAPQRLIQLGLEHLQGWDIHNSLGKLFQCFTALRVKKCLLNIQSKPTLNLKSIPTSVTMCPSSFTKVLVQNLSYFKPILIGLQLGQSSR